MLDKRTSLGKMVDNNKVVYTCIRCNYSFVGDLEYNITQCPSCKHTDTLVINGSFLVRK